MSDQYVQQRTLLDGIRIVDLSVGIAGAHATKILADFGAEVLKVEKPGSGDPMRAYTAAAFEMEGARPGGLFRFLNTGKLGLTADLGVAGGRERVRELIATADLVVESFRPGTLDAWSLGWEDLRQLNPSVSLVSISNFGQTGPYRDLEATDLTLQAESGYVAAHGKLGRPPLGVPGHLVQLYGGVYAALGGLTAILRTGVVGPVSAGEGAAGEGDGEGTGGEHVDVSLFEAANLLISYPTVMYSYPGPVRYPTRHRPIPSVEPCKDGYIGVNVLTAQQWHDLCTMVGAEHLADDPQLATMAGRLARPDEVYAVLHSWLAEHEAGEVLELGQAFRIPVAVVSNGATLPATEHFIARRALIEHPGTRSTSTGFTQPRSPLIIDGELSLDVTAAPEVGEHDHLWDSLTYRSAPVSAPPPPAATPPAATATARGGSFEGIRVVELGAFWAGPFATEYLASVGMDVIKVEAIQRVDGFRFQGNIPSAGPRWHERGSIFHAVNLDKRGVTIDCSRAEGIELLQRLIATADVLVENYTPRVMKQWGLDEATVRKIRPDIVMMRMPAFGLDGPWRDHAGFAFSLEQASGMAYPTGYPDERPLNPGGSADALVGAHAACAVMAALERRRRTGEGAHIEAAQVELLLAYSAEQVIEYSLNGHLIERNANRVPVAAPQGTYPCAGDEQWVALSIVSDEQWVAFRTVLGDPAWASEPTLATHAGRWSRHDELDERISAWSRTFDRDKLVQMLRDARLPAAAVLKVHEPDGHPQLEARHFFEEVTHPLVGTHRFPTWPIRSTRGPARYHRAPAPFLGEHNHEVFAGLLGLSEPELHKLEETRIIGTEPLDLPG